MAYFSIFETKDYPYVVSALLIVEGLTGLLISVSFGLLWRVVSLATTPHLLFLYNSFKDLCMAYFSIFETKDYVVIDFAHC